MHSRLALGCLCAVTMMACSASPEDRAKGARLVALETEQAQIMSTSTDCEKMRKTLDAWYTKHKAEVDELRTWEESKSERGRSQAREGLGDQMHANANIRIAAMVQCGSLSWNGKRP